MKEKRNSSKKHVSNMFIFLLLLLAIAGIAIGVFLLFSQQVTYSHLNNKSGSSIGINTPTQTLKLQTIQLPEKAILASGWKTYEAPSHCFEFSLPPHDVPIYNSWLPQPETKQCDPGWIIVTQNGHKTSLTIAVGIGGHGLGPDKHVTYEDVYVESYHYTLTKVTSESEKNPEEIIARPDQSLNNELPSMSSRFPLNQDNYREEQRLKDIELFYSILQTFRFTKDSIQPSSN